MAGVAQVRQAMERLVDVWERYLSNSTGERAFELGSKAIEVLDQDLGNAGLPTEEEMGVPPAVVQTAGVEITDAEAKRAAVVARFATTAAVGKAQQVLEAVPRPGADDVTRAAYGMAAWTALKLLNGTSRSLQRLVYALRDGKIRARDSIVPGSTVRDATLRLLQQLSQPTLAVAVARAVGAGAAGVADAAAAAAAGGIGGSGEASDVRNIAAAINASSLGSLYCQLLAQGCYFPYLAVWNTTYICTDAATDAALSKKPAASPAAGELPEVPPAAGWLLSALERSDIIEQLAEALLAAKAPPPPPGGEGDASGANNAAVIGRVVVRSSGTAGPRDSLMLAMGSLASAMSALTNFVNRLAPPERGAIVGRLRRTPLAVRTVAVLLGPACQRLQRCMLRRFIGDMLPSPPPTPPAPEAADAAAAAATGRGSGWPLLDALGLHRRMLQNVSLDRGSKGRRSEADSEDFARDVVMSTLAQPALSTWRTYEQLRMGDGGRGGAPPLAPVEVLGDTARALAALREFFWDRRYDSGPGSMQPEYYVNSCFHNAALVLANRQRAEATACLPAALEVFVQALAVELDEAERQEQQREEKAVTSGGKRRGGKGGSSGALDWRATLGPLVSTMHWAAVEGGPGTASLSAEQRADLASRLVRAGWLRQANRALRLVARTAADADAAGLSNTLSMLVLLVKYMSPPADLLAAAAGVDSAAAAAGVPTGHDGSSGGGPAASDGCSSRCADATAGDLTAVLTTYAKLMSRTSSQMIQIREAIAARQAEAATAAGPAATGPRPGRDRGGDDLVLFGMEASLQERLSEHDRLAVVLHDLAVSLLGALGERRGLDIMLMAKPIDDEAAAVPPPALAAGALSAAAAAELRGALVVCLRAGCAAAAGRLTAACRNAAAYMQSAAASAATAQRRRQPRGMGGGGGLALLPPAPPVRIPSRSEAEAIMRDAHCHATLALGWLAWPLAEWLPTPRHLLPAQPLELLLKGLEWLSLSLAAKPDDTADALPYVAVVQGGRMYGRDTVCRAALAALLALASHRGLCGDVRAGLLDGIAEEDEDEGADGGAGPQGRQGQQGKDGGVAGEQRMGRVVQELLVVLSRRQMDREAGIVMGLVAAAAVEKPAVVEVEVEEKEPAVEAARTERCAAGAAAFREIASNKWRSLTRGAEARGAGAGGRAASDGQEGRGTNNSQVRALLQRLATQGLPPPQLQQQGAEPEQQVVEEPAPVAVELPRMCANPRCGNFGGAAEAELKLKQCAGCRAVRYCGAQCQREHWAGGHKAECKRG